MFFLSAVYTNSRKVALQAPDFLSAIGKTTLINIRFYAVFSH